MSLNWYCTVVSWEHDIRYNRVSCIFSFQSPTVSAHLVIPRTGPRKDYDITVTNYDGSINEVSEGVSLGLLLVLSLRDDDGITEGPSDGA